MPAANQAKAYQAKITNDIAGRIEHERQNVDDPDVPVQWVAEFLAGLAIRNGIGEIIGDELSRFFKHKATAKPKASR